MELKGYHFRNQRRRGRKHPQTNYHHRLFSGVLVACSLLLTSSVQVASLAMQPRLVELWKCRAQHLNRVYSKQKHKQRGTGRGVYSDQYCYIPMILMLWLVLTGSAVLSVSYMETIMGE